MERNIIVKNGNAQRKLLYIHGYGSDGNAKKKQILQDMFPDSEVLSPTFDYARLSPYQVRESLQKIVGENDIRLIVGSSTGGFHAIVCSMFSDAEIWAVNPVSDLEKTFRRMALLEGTVISDEMERALAVCRNFQTEVFDRITLPNTRLNFALSTDDEVLGDHTQLKKKFANCGKIVELDNSGHHFLRFDELKEYFIW